MPKENVIVGIVSQILAPVAPTSGQPLLPRPGVSFVDGRLAFFDLSDFSSVDLQVRTLETLRRTGWPAHIELRAEHVIAKVRIPEIGRVLRVSKRTAGDYEATLDSCEARFLVDASTHAQDLHLLQSSAGKDVFVVIAERDGDWIFDAQLLPEHIVFEIPRLEPVRCGPEVIKSISIIENEARIDELVSEMLEHTCCLPAAPVGCIPFLYAKRGCWSRAHRMCELLAKRPRPVIAGKLWLFGNLRFYTQNVEKCLVDWGWHVAPFVRLRTDGGEPEIRVIDPSMFTTRSVTCQEWVDAQNGKTALLLQADAWVYMLTERCFGRPEAPNPTGSGVRETDMELDDYRQKLQDIAPGRPKPPPFDHCSVPGRPTAPRTTAESLDPGRVGPAPE